jgi:hypothetical protein
MIGIRKGSSMSHFSQPSVHQVADIKAEFARLGDFAVIKLAFIGGDAREVRLDIYGESGAVERLAAIAAAINAATAPGGSRAGG